MSAENKEVVESDESQSFVIPIDKSRRSFAKAGVFVPAIMSMASRTALGNTLYECTPSGQMSGNLSSHPNQNPANCQTGLSPSTWCDNAHINDGSTPGGCHHWKAAGVCPTDVIIDDKDIQTITEKKYGGSWKVVSSSTTGHSKRRRYKENLIEKDDLEPSKVCDPIVARWEKLPQAYQDYNPVYSSWSYIDSRTRTRTKTSIVQKTIATSTKCNEILGDNAPNSSCRDELLKSTVGMDAVAVTNYLNCATGQGPEGVTADMIREIYICFKNGVGTYTTPSGFTLDSAGCGEFLIAICPT